MMIIQRLATHTSFHLTFDLHCIRKKKDEK